MTEILPHCSEKVIQPRMQWNLVNKLAKDISFGAKEGGIEPSQIVFVGGFAAFLHAKMAIGNKAVNKWRGTEDVDMVITERGGTGKILAALQKSNEFQFIDSAPSHFVNKQTWRVQNKPQGYLTEPDRSTDVDVYFLDNKANKVIFNDRKISPYPDKFIANKVELVNFSRGLKKSSIAIPSVEDCLIMKLDVARVSDKLREKDIYDIISLFTVAEKRGIKESDLLRTIYDNTPESDRQKIKGELLKIFSGLTKCYQDDPIAVEGRVFLPSNVYVKSCRDVLNKFL